MTEYICPKCKKTSAVEGKSPPLCVPCDYTEMVERSSFKAKSKPSLERVLAMGLIATLPQEEQSNIQEARKAIDSILNKLNGSEKTTVFLIISAEFMENAR